MIRAMQTLAAVAVAAVAVTAIGVEAERRRPHASRC